MTTPIQKLYKKIEEAKKFQNADAKETILSASVEIKKLTPIALEDYYIKAQILYAEDNLIEAEELLENALEQKPDYLEAIKLLGYIHIKKRKYILAAEHLKKVIRIDPNNIEVLDQLGNIYDELNDQSLAIEYFDKIIERAPTYTSAYNNKAVALKKQGDYSKAIDALLTAIYIHKSGDKQCYYNLAQLYVLKKLPHQAMEHFDKAILLDSHYAAALYDRGLNHITLGNYTDATLDFKSALYYADKSLLPTIEEALMKIRNGNNISSNNIFTAEHRKLSAQLQLSSNAILSPKLYLELVSAIYYDRDALNQKWNILKETKIRDYKYCGITALRNDDGKIVLVHKIRHQYLKKFKDASSAQQLQILEQVAKDALNFVEELHLANPKNTFSHKGHGCSAVIAEICALKRHEQAVTFESVGSKQLVERLNIFSTPLAQENIVTYLTRKNNNMPFTHLGEIQSIDVNTPTESIPTLKKSFWDIFKPKPKKENENFSSPTELLASFDPLTGLPKKIAQPQAQVTVSTPILLKRFSPIAQDFLRKYIANQVLDNEYNFDEAVFKNLKLENGILSFGCALTADEFLYYIEDKIKTTQKHNHKLIKTRMPSMSQLPTLNRQVATPIALPSKTTNDSKSKTIFPSLLTPSISLSHDSWAVSLVCNPHDKLPDHAFLIVEGMTEWGKMIYRRYDLYRNKTQQHMAYISVSPVSDSLQNSSCNPSEREEYFNKEILKGKEACARSWSISIQQALQLHKKVIEDKHNPPHYHKLGSKSFIVNTSKAGNHSCFTWAREKLNELKEPSIHINEKITDFIGAKTSFYLRHTPETCPANRRIGPPRTA